MKNLKTTPPLGHGYWDKQPPYDLRRGTDPNWRYGDALEQAQVIGVQHVGGLAGRLRDAAAAGTSVTLHLPQLAGVTCQVETAQGAPVAAYTDATLATPLDPDPEQRGQLVTVGSDGNVTLYLPGGGYQLRHGGGTVSFEVR